MSDDNEKKLQNLQRAYEMQKRAREEAEQMLEEKSRELYQYNESLKDALEKVRQQQAQLVTQEKLASVGQLGASLAHELNNPTAFVKNNLQTLEEYVSKLAKGLDEAFDLVNLLARGNSGLTTPEVEKQLASIRDHSEIEFVREDLPELMKESFEGTSRITSIANSLRYFANPNRSKQREFDVNESIAQAQTLIRHKDQLINIDFDLQDLPVFFGLPMLLSQALANIIQNAVEATHNGEPVTVCSYTQNEDIVIEIEDAGEGMSKTTIDKLFTPFFTTKESHNGLGLCIAKQIIDQHEGTINITSNKGEGCSVKITLPHTHTNAGGEQ